MIQFIMLTHLRLALLSLWLGAMMFFSFFVAPAAFKVLPSTYLAGQVVSHTLGGLEWFGLIVGALLLILLLSRFTRSRMYFVELVAVVLMLASTAISKFVVSARLHQTRVEWGEKLQTLAVTDPVRLTFDQLHQISVWLTGFNTLVALALIVWLTIKRRG